jgi:hypothetical protein
VSGRSISGLAAALGAALLYGGAPVVQATVTPTVPPARGLGLGLLWQLLRRPVWLIALIGEIGGFVCEAYAFSVSPTMLVAPVASCDLLVFVLVGSIVFRHRPSRVGVLGVAATLGGVIALAFASRDSGVGQPASTATLIGLLVGCPIVVGTLAGVGQRAMRSPSRAAVAFSAGAGIAYGVATLATRQIGRTFHLDRQAVERLLTGPAPYTLAVCSVLGIALLQRGLQAAPLLTFPIVSGLSAFLPVVLSIGLLSDPVPAGGRRVLLIVALMLIALGLVLLGLDRTTERPQP